MPSTTTSISRQMLNYKRITTSPEYSLFYHFSLLFSVLHKFSCDCTICCRDRHLILPHLFRTTPSNRRSRTIYQFNYFKIIVLPFSFFFYPTIFVLTIFAITSRSSHSLLGYKILKDPYRREIGTQIYKFVKYV